MLLRKHVTAIFATSVYVLVLAKYFLRTHHANLKSLCLIFHCKLGEMLNIAYLIQRHSGISTALLILYV